MTCNIITILSITIIIAVLTTLSIMRVNNIAIVINIVMLAISISMLNKGYDHADEHDHEIAHSFTLLSVSCVSLHTGGSSNTTMGMAALAYNDNRPVPAN